MVAMEIEAPSLEILARAAATELLVPNRPRTMRAMVPTLIRALRAAERRGEQRALQQLVRARREADALREAVDHLRAEVLATLAAVEDTGGRTARAQVEQSVERWESERSVPELAWEEPLMDPPWLDEWE